MGSPRQILDGIDRRPVNNGDWVAILSMAVSCSIADARQHRQRVHAHPEEVARVDVRVCGCPAEDRASRSARAQARAGPEADRTRIILAGTFPWERSQLSVIGGLYVWGGERSERARRGGGHRKDRRSSCAQPEAESGGFPPP